LVYIRCLNSRIRNVSQYENLVFTSANGINIPIGIFQINLVIRLEGKRQYVHTSVSDRDQDLHPQVVS